MVQSRVLTFTSPDRYRTLVRAAALELLVNSMGDFRAELTQIDLHRLWMQRGSDSLPRSVQTSIDPNRVPVVFLADAHQAPMRVGRAELAPEQLVLYGPGSTSRQQTSGPSRWASLSLAPADLMAACIAIAGRELTAPTGIQILRPDPRSLARLRFLHDEADRIARTTPDTLARPEVAKALEQASVRAMIACLPGTTAAETRSWRRRARVIARVEDFLTTRRYEPVYMAEICAAVGVSERTLRTCCHEHFGTSPVRYLWLRRMHLARRALLRADPAVASVTGIATDHGFWELGRFSVEYRALFGETPSATLRGPSDWASGRQSLN